MTGEKARLRREMAALRDGLSLAERAEKSRAIARAVLVQPETAAAETVLVYLSFRSEPETHALTRTLLRLGKRVAAPRCGAETMEAAEIGAWETLRTGRFGIAEPVGATVPKEEIDLILVPALAFDREGHRLGWGGGYYDRYLADFHGTSFGLAFECCLLPRLPREETDRAVTRIITEKTEGEREWHGNRNPYNL